MNKSMWQTFSPSDFLYLSMTTDNIVTWVTRLSIVDGVYFQDADFAGHLEDSISTSGDSCVSLEVEHSSPLVGCARNQTSVSTILPDQKIISSDVSLRTDGIPALDLSDVVIEVLRSSNSIKPPTNPAAGNCSRNHKSNPKQKGNREVDQLSHVDYVTTNAHSSQGGVPVVHLWRPWSNCSWSKLTLRAEVQRWHVSRTHRVALDGCLI